MRFYSLLVCLCKLSPVNVFSHRPAFQSLMVLSADPDSIRPCSGTITTAHTAAVCPYCKQAEIWLCHTARSYVYLFQLQRCNHFIHTNVYRSHCHRKHNVSTNHILRKTLLREDQSNMHHHRSIIIPPRSSCTSR